jgi:hypothetical protein
VGRADVFLMLDVFLMFADDDPTHLTAKGFSLGLSVSVNLSVGIFPTCFVCKHALAEMHRAGFGAALATQESELRAVPTGCYGHE